MNLLSDQKCNITVLGAGSIGCYIGGCLTVAGVNTRFIGRQHMQQQLHIHGLTLTDWRGRRDFLAARNINYSVKMNSLIDADFIFVTVKSGDTLTVSQDIAKYAKSTSIIVSLQNGISNAQLLRQALPNFKVLSGMVPFNVLMKGKGKLHCGTEGNLAIEDPLKIADPVVHALALAGLKVDIYDDLTRIQWTKLLLNLNNAINALSGIPLLEQLSNRDYRKVLALAITEALTIMKVAGIKPIKSGKVIPKLIPYILRLPTWLYKVIASSMLKIDPTARSSMFEDLTLCRKTEIDYLNGEIVELAKKHQIPCYVNACIMQLIKKSENEQLGSPHITATQLLQYVNRMRLTC